MSGVLRTAYRAGVPTAAFWEQTPFETRLCVEAYNEIRLDENELFMHTAWHVGDFSRVKDMPRLSEMLAPYRKSRQIEVKAKEAVETAAGPDPEMSRNLMNALLQFPAGKVPGERFGDRDKSPEVPPA